jgi:hypothetical protein
MHQDLEHLGAKGDRNDHDRDRATQIIKCRGQMSEPGSYYRLPDDNTLAIMISAVNHRGYGHRLCQDLEHQVITVITITIERQR